MTLTKISLFIFIPFFTCLIHGESLSDSFVYVLNDAQSDEVIFNCVQEPFLLEKINFEADVSIQKPELYYLFGLQENTIIQADDILRGLKFLKRKSQFKKVTGTFMPGEKGKIMNVFLHGAWTFQTVKIKGLLTGNDNYLQYYMLEPGDLFDINKHNHSINNIKKAFYDKGYFECSVVDYLDYKRGAKSVKAHISLNPGVQFFIDDVDVSFKYDDKYRFEVSKLKKKIHSLFMDNLKNKPYTKEIINKETLQLKSYLIKKGFINAAIGMKEMINYHADKVKLIFRVNVFEKKSFVFFGNHFYTNKQLQDQILIFGSSSGILPESILAQEIEKAYKKEGFWDVVVQVQQEEDRIFFVINEGERCTVNEICLKGIESFDTQKIEKKFFSSLIKQRFFDEDMLYEAVQELTDFYISQGFWDIVFLQQDFTAIHENSYRLLITIDEGPRRYLNTVIIQDFPALEKQGPFYYCRGFYGKPFDPAILQEQKAWLLSHFQNKGYLYVTVSPEFIYEDERVTVLWHINNIEKQVHFGKTIVVGNTTFPFKYIERELAYASGDLWSNDALQKTLSNLRRLDIFETINVFPDNITQQEQEKTVIIKLKEDDPCEIRLRAGVQQVSRYFEFQKGTTYKIGGSFWYKNPFNVGDHFRFDADVAKYYRNISIKYTRPWLFYAPLYTVMKGYSNKYIQPVVVGSKEPLYEAIQEGGLFGIERHFTNVDFGFSVGVENMETKMLSLDMARAISFAPALIDRKIPYFYLEQSVLLDFLDNKLNPTQGSLTAITGKAMFPWKKNSVIFFKMLFEQSFFMPIAKGIVCGARLRFGHIFNQTFPNIMPPERFYLGGPHSLRGYEPDITPPLGSFINDDGKRIFVPQGGRSILNIMAEIRIPVFGSFGIVFFQDAGVLAKKGLAEIKGKKFLAATGAGLRYNTPIGPLRFDLGVKWKVRNPAEKRYAWFLTLGHAF